MLSWSHSFHLGGAKEIDLAEVLRRKENPLSHISNNIIHISIQFLVSCLEHLYRETEKESTKYPCALDSRGTILEKEIKQTKVTAC